MAANLLRATRSVAAFDTNPVALGRLEALGARTCASPSDVARLSQVVITMLPSGAAVREVFTTPVSGVLAGVRRGTLLLDCSTVDVDTPRALARTATDLGVDLAFMDAPVSGGVAAAEAGTLTFLVGGTEAHYVRAEAVLRHMGKSVMHCGPIGSGQAVKLANNLALGISMVGIAEAMLLGTRLGVAPEVLAKALNNATARCWSSEVYNPYPGIVPTAPASKGYAAGFTVNLMRKDLHLAEGAAQSVGLRTPLGQRTTELYDAISPTHGGLDFSVVLKALDEQSPPPAA
eukprot:TRINITY_DN14039_c0_g1_i1.p1 TRINITY_DN14039_c0_g1~~TRINITY_DN14039_c0_g1_i1.p1  ORF type:complete len:289 (+),score=53.65 TRINITY_DN14039_c0_g1_i1:76-942(+)